MTVPLINATQSRRLVTRPTSTPVAPAARREVTDRTLLGEDFVVSVKLPQKMNKMTVPTTGVAYQQFGVPVKGGYLNFHLYDGTNCRRAGNRIWVVAQVFEKTMADGVKFIYVDLRPTTAEHLTHDMKVHQDVDMSPVHSRIEGQNFFCFGKIRGMLTFLPRGLHEEVSEET